MNKPRHPWLMPASLLLALVLGLLPLPESLQPYRPHWLALALAYWVIEGGDRIGLGLAFLLGALADIAYGGMLGEQALRLVVLVFILQRFRLRLRFFPLPQQASVIAALLLNDRIISAVLHLALNQPQLPWRHWWGPVVGLLLWPPLFLLLDSLRRERRG